jgi:hypothetical protein
MKTLTAKQRTVSLFAGSTWAEEQVDRCQSPIETGPDVWRVALTHPPTFHFRLAPSPRTLCGLAISIESEFDGPSIGLGTCQHCPAEASRLRAVVGR